MSALEASAAQQRFWFLQQLDSDAASAQTLSVCLQLDGIIDLDRLEAALRTVIARHEVLRSTYRWDRDRLVGSVLPVRAVEILQIGSREVGRWDQERALSHAQKIADEPFDIARGPLLRATLVANGPAQSFLILAVHHMVWDAWSYGILLSELSAGYADSDELKDLPGRYFDYAEGQRQRSGDERGERDLAYWCQQLEGLGDLAPLAREIHADEHAMGIHKRQVDFGSALKEQIVSFCRDHAVTPFSVFMASLQVLFHRMGFGGESSLGVPLADRGEPRFEALMGCFLNTVVLRGSVSGTEPFEQLAAGARDRTLEALQHGGLPFEVMAQRLAPGRDLLRAPLYQALLVFQNTPQKRLAVTGVKATTLHVPRTRGRVDPTFTVWFERPELTVDFEWNGTPVVSAERLLECWQALLAGGLKQPQAHVDDLPLVVGSAARPSTGQAAPSAAAAARVATVPELLRGRAQSGPETLAVIGEGLELSLGELVRRSAAVAQRLQTAGVGPGVIVGLAAQRSPETIIAALGILEAGGACLPLDPEYPSERLRFMVEDSGAALVVGDGSARCAWAGTTELALDGRGGARVGQATRRVCEGIAWVLYTSGSTGQPKAVLISHEMVVARLRREPIPWGPDERVCHKTSLNFIDSIWEMFGPLTHGLPTVVADSDTARDPRQLARLLERSSVTRIVLVPSLLDVMLDLDPEDLARLTVVKYWISSGEALTASLAERFYAAFPDATLVNLYGTSECWDVSWYPVPASVRGGDSVPIGQPLSAVRVWLLDDGLNPVPPEVPGELFVGGPCVSRGYLARPDLTTASFIPTSSLGEGEHDLVYRTGDIARWTEDGALELLGRRDLQVKMRGFRLELEEIERRLLATPTVIDAAVAPQRDEAGTVTALAAFVVLAAGAELDVSALRKPLVDQLPAPLVPSVFIRVEGLPLTPNGKLDRGALHVRGSEQQATVNVNTTPEHIEPCTDAELALARIWSDLLGAERIGTTDNFFELGGHSLLAVQVVIRVGEELGSDVSLRDFYDRPTIAGLSACLTR